MARGRRVRETYIGARAAIELRYPAKFDGADVDAFRPILVIGAELGDEIRDRFRTRKQTAEGASVPTGHERSGAMWRSLTVSALSGKRGDKVNVSFTGRDGAGVRNKDKAWWASQIDGLSMLTPTNDEAQGALDGLTMALGDFLTYRLNLEPEASSGGQSELAASIRSRA